MSMVPEFFDAIAGGDLAGVESLLHDDPALAGAFNDAGISAVLWAAYHRQSSIAERLLAAGVDLNVFDAAAVGDMERLRLLLRETPSLAQASAADGFSALGLAAFFGRLEAVELLLACGADPNAASRNAMQVTALHSATAHGEPEASMRMVEALLRAGADPNVRQQGGWTPLHQAAAGGRTELLELLLSHGADVHARSEDGQTPEQKALEGGQLTTVERLRRQTPAKPTFSNGSQGMDP